MLARRELGVDQMVWTSALFLLLCFVLFAAMLGVLHLAASRPRGPSRADLDHQFARGELSIEEYRERRRSAA